MANRGRPATKPGHYRINERSVKDAPGRPGCLRLQWRVCLWDGTIEKHETVMRTDVKSKVVERATETALRLLGGRTADDELDADSSLADYITGYAIPELAEADLKPRTVERFTHELKLFAEAVGSRSIRTACRGSALRAALHRIEAKHGTATAKQTLKVVSKYVMAELVSDDIIARNPLARAEFNPRFRGDVVAAKKPQGGQALTAEERERVIAYLLERDNERPSPKRGRYTHGAATALQQAAVDVTLLQSVTGLRIGEACSLTHADVSDEGGRLTLTVRKERSKTKKGRSLRVYDERVAERIRERIAGQPQRPQTLVFGSPGAPDREWDPSNRQRALKALYREVADACDVPLLREVSTHVWRTTVNEIWTAQGVPEELRARHLGHTPQVNRESYTDGEDLAAMDAYLA